MDWKGDSDVEEVAFRDMRGVVGVTQRINQLFLMGKMNSACKQLLKQLLVTAQGRYCPKEALESATADENVALSIMVSIA
jgi:hypothetical protein